MNRLEPVLAESDRFERSLTALFEQHRWAAFSNEPRIRISIASALLSLEHAGMVRLAFTSDSPNSGSALLRLQFECLLKSAWLLHAANGTQISKLADDLNPTSEQAAKNLPSVGEMLASLAANAPPGLSLPLKQFHEASSRALNSFVHGGIHPISRLNRGFPNELACQLVRLSNGLLHMGYRMLATLSGSPVLLTSVTQTYLAFIS